MLFRKKKREITDSDKYRSPATSLRSDRQDACPTDKRSITLEQGIMANALTIQAIIRTLIKKGVLTQEEVLEEIKKIGEETKRQQKT